MAANVVPARLQFGEARVQTLLRDQLRMLARFQNVALIHHQDMPGVMDGNSST
jgi:hypothetical protein